MGVQDLYRRQTAILTSIFLALVFLLWWVTPWKSFLAGFFMGGVAGLYNALYLIRKLRLMDEQPMSAVSGKRRVNTGLANRFLMAAFPMLLAVRFPEWIDYRSVLLGLPVPYILLIAVGLRHTQRQFSREKR
ncbi:ATP synthase subunit I [Polycladomyces subterraneus]|uniref:ATP synthase subunit I n=1 Tax=Polycladomyces subterraneus TaxID=1016997 RepID=A0ABT8IJ62_9BACL|nr:ATP synthase subunit I [Polycladomyces subterraneus]MDN4592783.1 ATP synthase subunit I [Polycladomyces subterraneus]